MSKAAQQQAKVATGPIGETKEVKAESRQAASLLRSLAAGVLNPPQGVNPQIASAFAQDAGQISSGLDALADSQTDEQFTEAVFAMCDPDRKAAAPRVGQVMLGIANGIRTKPPPNLNIRRAIHRLDHAGELG
jgi:hypothetical protein